MFWRAEDEDRFGVTLFLSGLGIQAEVAIGAFEFARIVAKLWEHRDETLFDPTAGELAVKRMQRGLAPERRLDALEEAILHDAEDNLKNVGLSG
ncbi:MAG: hypothetical protein WCF18_08460 [Chthoniobacteraceae bacterium]